MPLATPPGASGKMENCHVPGSPIGWGTLGRLFLLCPDQFTRFPQSHAVHARGPIEIPEEVVVGSILKVCWEGWFGIRTSPL